MAFRPLRSAVWMLRVEPRREIQAAMAKQTYTDEGTAPRTTFRFLAAPSDANWGGNVHGGTVMRWIDETAFACAASWSSSRAVAVYAGGIHFHHPIHIGDIVQVDARLIHTGPRSMHISVQVRSANPCTPIDSKLTTRGMSIFVDVAGQGRAVRVTELGAKTAEDARLNGHALELAGLRVAMPPIPADFSDRKSQEA
jgi:acyl-CoA hydrolase